jgi:hypothetical protein
MEKIKEVYQKQIEVEAKKWDAEIRKVKARKKQIKVEAMIKYMDHIEKLKKRIKKGIVPYH